MKIVGFENKKGEWQGRPYNNWLIHCLVNDTNCIGKVRTEIIKFKASYLALFTDISNLDKLVGKDIETVHYDKFGNATSLQFKSN